MAERTTATTSDTGLTQAKFLDSYLRQPNVPNEPIKTGTDHLVYAIAVTLVSLIGVIFTFNSASTCAFKITNCIIILLLVIIYVANYVKYPIGSWCKLK